MGGPDPGPTFSYGFNLPPGSYDVTLHFAADPSWPGAASVYTTITIPSRPP